MAWTTLSEAAQRGPSLPTWERRIELGEVPSFRNAHGRRMVWLEGESSLSEIHRDVQAIRGDLWRVLQDLQSLRKQVRSHHGKLAEESARHFRPAWREAA